MILKAYCIRLIFKAHDGKLNFRAYVRRLILKPYIRGWLCPMGRGRGEVGGERGEEGGGNSCNNFAELRLLCGVAFSVLLRS